MVKRTSAPERAARRCTTDHRLGGSLGVDARTVGGHTPAAAAAAAAGEAFRCPASFAQERLWFIHQFEGARTAYNIPLGLRLRGPLEVDTLRWALTEIVQRHEVLRTRFERAGGQLLQVVTATAEVPLPVVDLQHVPAEADADADAREREAARLATEEGATAFDLATGPLLRTSLLRLGPEEHRLILVMHHIVSDGWSMAIFTKELTALYEAFADGDGRPSPLPPLAIQYGDFAVWQRQWLAGAELDRQLAYWTERLQGAPNLLRLPTDRPRPPAQTFNGGVRAFTLPAGLSQEVLALCRRQEATPFMVLLAAFYALLHRYTGAADIVVGSPIAGRNRAEIEDLIGFFVNTLVLRTDLSGDPSFTGLLKRVRETALGAMSHQDVPFEQLVEAVHPERDISHAPLFQVLFAMQNLPGGELRLPGLVVEPWPVDIDTSKFDLSLQMFEMPDGLAGEIEYNADLFDADTVDRLARHYEVLLGGVVRHPQRPISKLPLLPDDERRAVLVEWNDTASEEPGLLVHELVAANARATPDAAAVVAGDRTLSYADLDARANRLAHHLRAAGVGPETVVALVLDRSPEFVVALLAVLKAGGAFLPVDVSYPPARIEYLLTDSGASTVITTSNVATSHPPHAATIVLDTPPEAEAIAAQPPVPPAVDIHEHTLAYVIYTSGSTGTPKGVMVEHRGLPNLVAGHARLLAQGPGQRVLHFSAIGFDATVADVFMAIGAGGTLHLAARHELLPGRGLLQKLAAEQITTVTLPPSVLAALPDDDLPHLRTLIVAGEACPADLVGRWADGRSMLNLYGPTEATVWATWARLDPDDTRPPGIGRPIPNVRVYVLDHHGQPQPVGVPGEIHIGGVGVARGYRNRPDLTAERFVPDAFGTEPGGRLYRTGDLGRWRADGTLEFLGRADDQVKIRGFRVEPGEAEAAVRRHPGVGAAAVVPRTGPAGDTELVAYVAPAPAAGTSTLDGAGVRDFLRRQLPEWLVPARVVVLDALPLTAHGKVDRQALPEPGGPEGNGKAGVPPASPIEEAVAAIWAEVLGLPRIGVTEKFFDIGGNSLKIVDVHDRLATRWPGALTVADLFEHTTVRAIAARVEEATRVVANQDDHGRNVAAWEL